MTTLQGLNVLSIRATSVTLAGRGRGMFANDFEIALDAPEHLLI